MKYETLLHSKKCDCTECTAERIANKLIETLKSQIQ